MTSDFLTPDQRKKAIEDLIDYFATERDEEIGVIAAEEILDAMLEILGTPLYNAGIRAAQKAIETSKQNLDFEINTLIKDFK